MENIVVITKEKNQKWNWRAARRAKHVFHQCRSYWDCLNFISTFWTLLPRDQTEGLLSLRPQRKGAASARCGGGCLLILVRKLSSHNVAVLTLANNFQTSSPTRGFALFTSTWWKGGSTSLNSSHPHVQYPSTVLNFAGTTAQFA